MQWTQNTPDPGSQNWSVIDMRFSIPRASDLTPLADSARVQITYKSGVGEVRRMRMWGQDALTLLSQLNTADFTTNSLEQRALALGVSNGVLGDGSASGNTL